jgi:hypothetical protein
MNIIPTMMDIWSSLVPFFEPPLVPVFDSSITIPPFAVQLLLVNGKHSPSIIANAQVSSSSAVPYVLLKLTSSISCARMIPSPTKLLLMKHESEIESVASNPTYTA